MHALGGIRTRIHSTRSAADPPRLRPLVHCDGLFRTLIVLHLLFCDLRIKYILKCIMILFCNNLRKLNKGYLSQATEKYIYPTHKTQRNVTRQKRKLQNGWSDECPDPIHLMTSSFELYCLPRINISNIV